MMSDLKTEHLIGGAAGALATYYGIKKFKPNTNVYLHWGATIFAAWVGGKFVAPPIANLINPKTESSEVAE